MEEEKVLIHPTRIKQSFVDLSKNSNIEMKDQKEPVNDTLPDFGFVNKVEDVKPRKIKDNKVVFKKNPSEVKPPKKLKIK
jgi:hypothetical protein